MNEIKGCMNCGNISCGNNKKRESAGCGRWKTPEQKINELEEENSELREKNEGFQRVYSRMRDMGFPTFASVKEYAVKLKELEQQIDEMKSIGRTSYIKGIRTMANALKDYDRTDGAWTDYFEHTVDKVLKKLLEEIKEK